MDSIHDMRVMNTDDISNWNKLPEKCLRTAKKGNNNKYLEHCLQKCRNPPPFIVSVDGLLDMEAEAMPKCIASPALRRRGNSPSPVLATT